MKRQKEVDLAQHEDYRIFMMMTIAADVAFQISIFAPAGFQQALRLVEKDDWKGHALLCKRPVFPDIQHRSELMRPGVYILYGTSQDDESTTSIYIGEGDPTLPRLKVHFQQKDFWTDLICFSASDSLLSKSHIQYLEARLIGLAAAAKRCEIENVRIENLPTLSEAQIALSERFLQNMLATLNALGIQFFNAPSKASGNTGNVDMQLYLSGKGASAQGYESTNGFVVMQGSTAAQQLSNTFPAERLRAHIIADGVLIQENDVMRFSGDFEFESPSAAASIITGRSINGREAWHSLDGTTLKAIQERRIS